MILKSLGQLLILCLIATQFIACKKEVTSPSASLPITAGSIAGDFTINSFVSSVDQTSTFSEFSFTFNDNGTIIATKGSDTFNGTWKFDDSDSTELKLSFPDAPLNELNKGWHIEDITEDHMILTDDGATDDSNDDNPSHDSRIEFERD